MSGSKGKRVVFGSQTKEASDLMCCQWEKPELELMSLGKWTDRKQEYPGTNTTAEYGSFLSPTQTCYSSITKLCSTVCAFLTIDSTSKEHKHGVGNLMHGLYYSLPGLAGMTAQRGH